MEGRAWGSPGPRHRRTVGGPARGSGPGGRVRLARDVRKRTGLRGGNVPFPPRQPVSGSPPPLRPGPRSRARVLTGVLGARPREGAGAPRAGRSGNTCGGGQGLQATGLEATATRQVMAPPCLSCFRRIGCSVY